jgi:hypothetical protein
LDTHSERRYEARVVKYLMNRYEVSSSDRQQVLNIANEATGVPLHTFDALWQVFSLPVQLGAAVIPYVHDVLTIPLVMSGRVRTSLLGKRYRELVERWPETVGCVPIGLCFEYKKLKVANTVSTLVLHDDPPPSDSVEPNNVILCRGDDHLALAIEPLSFFLDRMDWQ